MSRPRLRVVRRVALSGDSWRTETATLPSEVTWRTPRLVLLRTAVAAPTGAGKTSIISLLSRFYDVQQGAILVDGVDVREVRQAELRRHIGVVLQDPVLFSGTISRNIRLLDEDITDEEVRRAAHYVNADTFIERFEDGYEHEVKERGANLSVGQRQLLTFARAIAFNPSVLLVMVLAPRP